MKYVEAWIALAAIAAIIVVTIQTLWDYRQRRRDAKRRHPSSQYSGWDFTDE